QHPHGRLDGAAFASPGRPDEQDPQGRVHVWTNGWVALDVMPTRHAEERQSAGEDRKSTRLNSSHVKISYAVFCLNEKKQEPRGAVRPSRPSCSPRVPFASSSLSLHDALPISAPAWPS